MNFFTKFPLSKYQFSENKDTVITDLFRYVSSEDKKLDGIINYTYYSVPEGMRPDVLSSKLYGTPDYHWTFFIINTALKQGCLSSWPKGITELENFIFEKYMKYAVIEMNPKSESYSYTLLNEDNHEETVKTSIVTSSVNGIVLDSNISFVSQDKTYNCQFISYKDDRIILKKNAVSSLSFLPNDNVYWTLPKIKLISEEGYNAEVSFNFSDSVHGQGSTLSDRITISNSGDNYFIPPTVDIDESPERECIFTIDLNNGHIVINYPGKNYCRVPKLMIKIPSISYSSPFLNVFDIDSSKNYGLKTMNGFEALPSDILDLINVYPNSYSAELTNSDNPLTKPIVYVSNSSAIGDNLKTFTLQNNSSDILKVLKWNIDLFNWKHVFK